MGVPSLHQLRNGGNGGSFEGRIIHFSTDEFVCLSNEILCNSAAQPVTMNRIPSIAYRVCAAVPQRLRCSSRTATISRQQIVQGNICPALARTTPFTKTLAATML